MALVAFEAEGQKRMVMSSAWDTPWDKLVTEAITDFTSSSAEFAGASFTVVISL